MWHQFTALPRPHTHIHHHHSHIISFLMSGGFGWKARKWRRWNQPCPPAYPALCAHAHTRTPRIVLTHCLYTHCHWRLSCPHGSISARVYTAAAALARRTSKTQHYRRAHSPLLSLPPLLPRTGSPARTLRLPHARALRRLPGSGSHYRLRTVCCSFFALPRWICTRAPFCGSLLDWFAYAPAAVARFARVHLLLSYHCLTLPTHLPHSFLTPHTYIQPTAPRLPAARAAFTTTPFAARLATATCCCIPACRVYRVCSWVRRHCLFLPLTCLRTAARLPRASHHGSFTRARCCHYLPRLCLPCALPCCYHAIRARAATFPACHLPHYAAHHTARCLRVLPLPGACLHCPPFRCLPVSPALCVLYRLVQQTAILYCLFATRTPLAICAHHRSAPGHLDERRSAFSHH